MGRRVATQAPFESVERARMTAPRSVERTRTVAPAMGDAAESMTLPTMEPVTSCE